MIKESAGKPVFVLIVACLLSAAFGCSEKRSNENDKRTPNLSDSQSKNSMSPEGQEMDTGQGKVCACCGYPTLTSRGMYEICQLCSWEDDPTYDPSHPDKVVGGANGKYTLLKARTNFKKSLTMYDPDDERANESKLSKETKRELMRAYEALAKATKDKRKELLEEIAKGKQTLLEELKKKLR